MVDPELYSVSFAKSISCCLSTFLCVAVFTMLFAKSYYHTLLFPKNCDRSQSATYTNYTKYYG